MSMTGGGFNWRGFWSDLLGGAGRGLLELDGSRAAEAALSGLDFFDAARRRRRSAQGESDPADVERKAWARLRAEMAAKNEYGLEGAVPADPYAPAPEAAREELEPAAAPYRDPHLHERRIAAMGLPPRVRPTPLSADPYDHPGLPVYVRLGQRGLVRRG